MTTHYIQEAERLCHRMAFIVDGRNIKIGTIKKLLKDAQKDQILQFSFDESIRLPIFDREFDREFSHCRIERINESVVQWRSSTALDLMPLTSGVDLLKAAINHEGIWLLCQVLWVFSFHRFLIGKRNIQHRWIY